ncbi:MAG: Hsp70 family protein, partial [Sedimentisphaerales bacterium]|nr:Hsp70 family protein [Sedimentisphaerales bacterium]
MDRMATNIAGIDLGTAFSALAVLNAIGRPQIVPNADGERLTPSAIYFDQDLIRVGTEALNCRYVNPDRCVRWVKRHIGDTTFRKQIDGMIWTAEALSALILKKLKQDAEAQVGPIRQAVITVPAHFDEIRRRATMDAGAAAGLEVIGIVNEPVAAALFYMASCPVTGKVLVYDLGGGTFDVTILQVDGHDMQIICSNGDQQLGGVDFDLQVFRLMEQAYQQATGTALIASQEDRARYEDEAEDIKKTLSRRQTVKKILYGPGGPVRFELSREEFEHAIAKFVAKTEMLIEVALDEAGLRPDDIGQVLLVGGSSRIPVITQTLQKLFGFTPACAVNVDEAVALGAAVHAGLTVLKQSPDLVPAGIAAGLRDIRYTDVCNHSYGTLCAPVDKKTGKRTIANHIIIRKNTPLPCEQTRTFYTLYDGQSHIEVTITQGEDTDPRYVNKIATYRFELPPGRPAGMPVRVTYSYDLNQRMHCRFEDVQSGKVLEVDLPTDGSCMPQQAKPNGQDRLIQSV